MQAIFPIHITTIRELREWVEKFKNQQDRLAVRQLVKFLGPKRRLSEVDATEPSCERGSPSRHYIHEAEVEAVQPRGCWNCGGLGR